jgi:hypothetical protein
MKTVWVTPGARRLSYVDVNVRSVRALMRHLHRLT